MLHTVVAIILIWSGITDSAPLSLERDRRSIQSVISQKEVAVNQHNKSRFLSFLHPQNNMYIQEQKRWFDDAVRYMDTDSFHIELIRMKKEGKDTIKAWVSQRYTRGNRVFQVRIPLVFRKTRSGWKDADIAFYKYKKGIFTVCYTDEVIRKQAKIALHSAQEAVTGFKKRYHWSPSRVEIKLYHQPEVFRQSVKPSLPMWAGGWHESRQAIKFIGGIIEDSALSQGIVHELTHQMVSELTNDNAAYWLQEGMAMYYERHLLGRTPQTPHSDKLLSISQLEGINLEKLQR